MWARIGGINGQTFSINVGGNDPASVGEVRSTCVLVGMAVPVPPPT